MTDDRYLSFDICHQLSREAAASGLFAFYKPAVQK